MRSVSAGLKSDDTKTHKNITSDERINLELITGRSLRVRKRDKNIDTITSFFLCDSFSFDFNTAIFIFRKAKMFRLLPSMPRQRAHAKNFISHKTTKCCHCLNLRLSLLKWMLQYYCISHLAINSTFC